MSLFDRIFGYWRERDRRRDAYTTFKMLNGYTPRWSTWGGEIYESELVRAAIDARARHISKLAITVQGTAKPALQNKLRLGPNEWQTWGQFLARLSTILDVQTTAIVAPVINSAGETTGVYPVLPDRAELVDYNGTPWMRMRFGNGSVAAVEYDRVGILTKFQYRNDFFGEGNKALHPTMELIHVQDKGIAEGVKAAASFRFMAKMGNWTDPEDLVKERERFTRNNLESGSGLLLWPNDYTDIKQIESKPFVVDAEQMNLIRSNVFDYFGVNEDVLQNKTIGDAWAAFYEGAIEPFAIQLSDVLTRMLFTQRERELGAGVMATSNRLQYMSNSDKLAVSAQMADRGLMSRNEIRQIWNLPPLPEPTGDQLPVRGEYYNVGDETQEETNGEG